ncbi:MAG: M1 family peptidase, partial [Bacteroidetes bacterium]
MKRALLACLWCLLALLPLLGQVERLPDSRIDILHYDFDLTLTDSSDRIRGLAEMEVQFLADGVAGLSLDLVREGAQGTGMTVSGVWAGLKPLKWTHEAERLSIDLARPSRAGETLRLRITYAGIPADGLIIGQNRHGDRTFFGDNWPNRAHHWLPVVDHPAE